MKKVKGPRCRRWAVACDGLRAKTVQWLFGALSSRDGKVANGMTSPGIDSSLGLYGKDRSWLDLRRVITFFLFGDGEPQNKYCAVCETNDCLTRNIFRGQRYTFMSPICIAATVIFWIAH
jgi:hypothetical protein